MLFENCNLGKKGKLFNHILEKLLIGIFIFFISFIFALQSSNDIWHTGITYTDSSVFKYVARVIIAGGMPYRDTFDHKGPLIYLIDVVGILIDKERGIWILELLTICSTFVFLYMIARLKCNKLVSLLILLLSSASLFKYFEGGNLVEEFALPFIAISIFIFLDYFLNSRINVCRLIVCGFSFGSVCMLRINMVAIWFVMCLGVLYQNIRKGNYKELLRFCYFFMIGIAIICVPIIIWLIYNHAFLEFIDDYFVFNNLYSKAMGMGSEMKITMRGQAFITFLNDGVVLFSICILIYNYIREKQIFDFFYLAYIFVNVMTVALSGRSFMHYGMVLVPALVYPFACLGKWCNNDKKGNMEIPLFLIYMMVVFALPSWLNAANNALQEYAGRDGNYIDDLTLQVTNIVKENSTESDEIIVCGNWNIIYNMAERFSASKYSYQNMPCTIDANRLEEYCTEVEQKQPKIIVLTLTNGSLYNRTMEIVNRCGYKEIFNYPGSETQGSVCVYGK